MRAQATTRAGRRAQPWEESQGAQRSIRVALRFVRLMENHARVGLTTLEIADKLDLSSRHAHRLVRAAELAGWPLVRDEQYRWRVVR